MPQVKSGRRLLRVAAFNMLVASSNNQKRLKWVVTLMHSNSQGSFLKFLPLVSEGIQDFVSRWPQAHSGEAATGGNGRGFLKRSVRCARRAKGALSEAVPSLSLRFGTTAPGRA
ncbi:MULTISPECIES: hypothetical protein [unclassified Bradyrhizobium]|uniref:hypothetical protein n=1 Tax=unclassified Bradyrhizobium TaxID=2631580 RepID=UPI001FF85838|nr:MULTISPECIES: hypothetical protein [unclassified Bradyrhizobium]MCK1315896.1 hypothetical protein [Bradyrhizobium sp. 23]MCK1349320.1 hypothetical protein [Bradyrhizobium sp. CW11]MCK1587724.1 hypothetical protein [Bradyrhizobium sp. 169]MCK1704682.1 hypothetical protein [Bradyrhizobium sp. 146]